MRNWVLGSFSVACVALSSTAWCAEDTPAGSAPSVKPVAPAAAAAAEPSRGPQQLPEGVRPPMPPDTDPLPPLPAAGPAYDAPLPPPPPPPPPSRPSEWGVQFRLEAAVKGKGASDQAGMGGIGFSLRPRPSPYFALDFGLDFIGGHDYFGDKRNESSLMVNPMVFLNPRNTVQVYLFAGLGVGAARVYRPDGERQYRYIGADAGIGVEMRFWRHFALSGDVLAFVRDRMDVGTSHPEYVDAATGRYTDSSGGALLRFGGTYYW